MVPIAVVVAGIAIGFLLGYQEKKRENIIHKMLAAACVLVTVAVLMWAVGSSIYYRLTI